MLDHFLNLQRLAEVKTTHFVRENSGIMTTRNDNEEMRCLPSYIFIRQCYAIYARENGYWVSDTVKRTIKEVDE